MFHQNNRGKIKNPKILGWRLELSHMTYNIRHKPGSENVTADAFSRACVLFSLTSLQNLHLLVTLVRRDFNTLYGSVIYLILVKRREKFVATVERVQRWNLSSGPSRRHSHNLYVPGIALSVDFKGPVGGSRPFSLTVIDEYSRLPFRVKMRARPLLSNVCRLCSALYVF